MVITNYGVNPIGLSQALLGPLLKFSTEYDLATSTVISSNAKGYLQPLLSHDKSKSFLDQDMKGK